MVGHIVAGDPLVMAAVERRRQTEMRGASFFPEAGLFSPVGFRTGAHRHPNLDPDLGRVTAGLFRQATQLAENVESALIGRIGIRHPTIAPFGDARQGAFVMSAVPYRHLARGRPRVDAGVLDRVPFALEAHMRLGPQPLHDLNLLLRTAAAIVEILIEASELDLVPANPNAEPETAAA